mmetsp:Transcript_43862/g.83762  ORF Transcript_43862/g.83762 Transcript_43862/m.83762 type:complete len:565 (-) Transcript_43862:356-2050(-)|eukprot:CAMPEP_0114237702 /NCGR_PEP_ID=MMETSP0058-20121206/7531_1 /TAXON_ID=36894 /ORGANISM="Pyramimonas parkeae, CCMP726" /LENGTH=564 /DNA_ID=CAMNT_0001349761 /DNA_START=36 /DNA_END=1730 /DNA_ORIENTATION=-
MGAPKDDPDWASIETPDDFKALGKDGNTLDSNGRTYLYRVSKFCSKPVVETALAMGGKVDVEHRSKTPLFVATRSENVGAVEALLAAGANPNIETNGGYTPLWIAARDGFVDIVTKLIVAGADPNHVQEITLTNCLMIACSEANEDTALAICAAPTLEVDATDMECGSTALWVAASVGFSKVVRFLIDAGADPNKANNYGRTPLMSAALEGHTSCCKILLECGADANAHDDNNETAVYMACSNGHAATVECLLTGSIIDVNDGNAEGETPLITAAWYGRRDVVELLVAHGAVADKSNQEMKTPLIASCWRNHADIAKFLLENTKIDVHKTDQHGRSALWAACRAGAEECVEMLLAAGADPDQKDNRQGTFEAGAGVASCTPLFAAAWCGHAAACEVLLRNGADPDDGDVEGRKPKDVAESDAVKEHLATYHALWVADNAPKPCKGKGTWKKMQDNKVKSQDAKKQLVGLKIQKEQLMKSASDERSKLAHFEPAGAEYVECEKKVAEIESAMEKLNATMDTVMANAVDPETVETWKKLRRKSQMAMAFARRRSSMSLTPKETVQE